MDGSNSPVPAAVQTQLDELEAQMLEEQSSVDEALVELEAKTAPQVTENTAVAAPVPEGTQSASAVGLKSSEAEPDYAHMYSCLKGKYDHEIGGATDSIEQKDRELERLREELREAKAAALQDQSLSAESLQERYNLSEGQSEYGPELLSAVQRIAQIEAERGRHQVEEMLKTHIEPLKGEIAAKSEQDFYKDLARLVPDWEAIDNSQPFHDWLRQIDPKAGVRNNELLLAARDQSDPVRAAAIYTGYRAETNQSTPTIDNQLAPSPGGATTEPSKPTYTFSQLDDMQAKITKQAYLPGQAEAIQEEINAAILEGRVKLDP